MAEAIALNHVSEDTLEVTGTARALPRPIKQSPPGTYKKEADGSPVYVNARRALIYVGGQPVRWRADGIAPDAAPGMGMYAAANTYISWTDPLMDFSALIANAKFVRAEGSTANAILEIAYFA